MSLVYCDPFNVLNQFHRELNRLEARDNRDSLSADNSDVSANHWRPAVDIKEEDNRFVILADLPGVDPAQIELTMEDGMLAIKGQRANEKEEQGQGFKRVERVRGTFYRRFSLPDTADAENIEAHGRDGVLEISVPRQEKLKPRKIAVSH